jgi:hypothetical protein
MNLYNKLTEAFRPYSAVSPIYADNENTKDLEFLQTIVRLYKDDPGAFRCIRKYYNGPQFTRESQLVTQQMDATRGNRALIRNAARIPTRL